RKELFKTKEKVNVVSNSLIRELYEETKLPQLEILLDKDSAVLTLNTVKEIKSIIYKKSRKGIGGRPRIEEDPSKLYGKKLQRYRFRIYKRRSRERQRQKIEFGGSDTQNSA
ncbi:MAG: hypothetical protein AB1695_14575, partial [Stygiobacter sp.]